MKLADLIKPEYIFRPRQLLKRVIARPTDSAFTDVILPWGLPIRVRPNEAHGCALRLLGVYDLVVTETLWRLIDAGETVVDVGANIGYMTAVMSGRLAGAGTVFCFEPHPQIFQELAYNVTRWRELLSDVRFECYQTALSDRSGLVMLVEPAGFEYNRGLARIKARRFEQNEPAYQVCVGKLDEVLAGVEEIHVLKVDVEGHEFEVLCGARSFLREHRVRDVVFEEHNGYPSATTDLLEAYGYHVYRPQKAFFGPRLLPPDAITPRSAWEPVSILATRASDRARRRLTLLGWSVLRGGVWPARRR